MTTPNDITHHLAIDARGIEQLKHSARQHSEGALKAAARQFEALFINMMLKSMREALPQDDLFGNQQGKMAQSMLDQQLGQGMASRGMGLAQVLIAHLSRHQHVAAETDNTGRDIQKANLAQRQSTARTFSMTPRATRVTPDARPHTLHETVLPFFSRADSGAKTADAVDKNAALKSLSRPSHVQSFQDTMHAHAQKAERKTGIPARFMLGQAALESGWGARMIRAMDGSNSHNLFGIKATPNWKGRTVTAMTTEYINGVPQRRKEKFRAYDSYADSFCDYANLLRSNPRYEKVLADARDAEGFAKGLQRAGYATDPHYAAKLVKIIKSNFSG